MKQKLTAKLNIPAIALTFTFLALWQLAAQIVNMSHILPGPVQIIIRTWQLRETLLLHHLPSTLITIVTGWCLSVIIGVMLALLMHVSCHAEAMLHPALVITQTIPVMCISPLFVVWLGYTLGARLIAVVLSTFFAITLNTYDGLQSTDNRKKELMKTYGAGRFQIFTQLEIPSALPMFMTSLKMTLPWAVIDAAVAEWLGATEGLGYFSRRMISKMDGAAVFAPILILCVITFIAMALIKAADRHLVPYRNDM